jgi:hypothetical protein
MLLNDAFECVFGWTFDVWIKWCAKLFEGKLSYIYILKPNMEKLSKVNVIDMSSEPFHKKNFTLNYNSH